MKFRTDVELAQRLHAKRHGQLIHRVTERQAMAIAYLAATSQNRGRRRSFQRRLGRLAKRGVIS